MKRIWSRIRAFLRGPSDDDLNRDLRFIRHRLDKLEEAYEVERERLIDENPKLARFAPPSVRRRGLEG